MEKLDNRESLARAIEKIKHEMKDEALQQDRNYTVFQCVCLESIHLALWAIHDLLKEEKA